MPWRAAAGDPPAGRGKLPHVPSTIGAACYGDLGLKKLLAAFLRFAPPRSFSTTSPLPSPTLRHLSSAVFLPILAANPRQPQAASRLHHCPQKAALRRDPPGPTGCSGGACATLSARSALKFLLALRTSGDDVMPHEVVTDTESQRRQPLPPRQQSQHSIYAKTALMSRLTGCPPPTSSSEVRPPTGTVDGHGSSSPSPADGHLESKESNAHAAQLTTTSRAIYGRHPSQNGFGAALSDTPMPSAPTSPLMSVPASPPPALQRAEVIRWLTVTIARP